ANRLSAFAATNQGGAIELSNNADTLTLSAIAQPQGGDVSVHQTGTLRVGTIQTTLGDVSLYATGSILAAGATGGASDAAAGGAAPLANIQAASIDLTSIGGNIGLAGAMGGGNDGGGGDGSGEGGGDSDHDHGLHLGRRRFDRPLYGPWHDAGQGDWDESSGAGHGDWPDGAPSWWFWLAWLRWLDHGQGGTASGDVAGDPGTTADAAPLVLDSSVGRSGVVTASAQGDIALSELQGNLDVNAAAGGNVRLTAEAGDLLAGSVATTTGDVTMAAAGSILASGSAGAALVQGNNLTLVAQTGSIGTRQQALSIDSGSAGGSVKAKAAGDVALDEISGDLDLWQVISTGGDVVLTADGNFVNAAPSKLINVEGDDVELTSRHGRIGSGQSPIAVLYGGSLTTDAASHGAHVVRLKSLKRGYELGPDWAASILGAA
ncbi:MAG TPA: hypothetical protein VFK80_04280, partial [Limnochordia bacterium]|nr:hypothetical protein [Limnochordia bacterium]